ncbi:MAG: ribonuclease III [Planctomycetes bacterium]|nr:ribonuclease III [Planctomycetota bacterium]
MKELDIEHCQNLLAYKFKDIELLRQALIHASLAATRLKSNERMEFLGDAVLGLVICEKLYKDHNRYLEGRLTKIKSVVVSRHMCSEVTDELGLSEMLQVGKGFDFKELPESITAGVLESVIGAIYLDGGLEPAREFILKHMDSKIETVLADQHELNYKSILQQYAQRVWNCTPKYDVLDEKGPDHAKAFEICVVCEHRRFASAWGNNKKQAEQLAAKAALFELEPDIIPTENDDGKEKESDSQLPFSQS